MTIVPETSTPKADAVRAEPMEADTPPQPNARYKGTNSGRVLRYRQLAYIGWKTETAVKRTGRGFVVDGELFIPIEDS